MSEGHGTVAAEVLDLLRHAGATLAVAESLTGGLLAAAITEVPGASAAFRGSVTAYATDVKDRVLAVPGGLLSVRGAVDPDVAAAMAEGVRVLLDADWAVATTGVAGPDEQDGKPVGTVYVAVAGPSGMRVTGAVFPGDRAEIRRATVERALGLLREALRGPRRPTATAPSGG
ncbi:CinA family protein [Allostreptomyces psammosilenae]|uniref:Nicotinamide-nucleotide amidase n=1 Tax=Allostreptomyces psammosilenae TaxID=1892865 RepID=A0A852ZQB0_9ACTN|nr:CinA family protein [Allostreptomyces psammosilenae]NYI03064.1 nicotinamide-nucleotide amidase [Allostreptomyces psammosilenae]